MEQKNIQLLKREFRFDEQGYTLVKTMVFVYAFKKANIIYPLYNERKQVSKYLKELCIIANEYLLQIDNVFENKFSSLIRDCIVSFNEYVQLQTGMGAALLVLNNMSVEDIEFFIINEADFSGLKDDLSTPDSIIELSIKLLKRNKKQTWLDLGCGNGSFLAKVAKNNMTLECLGDEINYNRHLFTKIKLYFIGVNYFVRECNVLHEHYSNICDVAFANTPFMIKAGKDLDGINKYNKFIGDIRQSQSVDWVFADRLIDAIKDRGIILMSEGSLMNIIDVPQRRNLIEKNLIEGVIKLPTNLFLYTGISVSIVIFNKNKTDSTIKFLDATKMCVTGRRLSELNVDEILTAYYLENQVAKVNINDISKEDYSLYVRRYLDVNDIVLENEVLLEEVVNDVFRGAQIPASMIDEYSKIENEKEVYKLISVGDIQNGSFDVNCLQVINDNGKFERYLVKNGDVLVSSKSTKIKTAIVELPENQKFVATGSILVIRCNQKKINSVYLKTFFDSSNGAKLLESIQTGTVIISINVSALLKMRISCVDRNLQDEIANKFLMKLDQFKITKSKLEKLERELTSVFDDSIGG